MEFKNDAIVVKCANVSQATCAACGERMRGGLDAGARERRFLDSATHDFTGDFSNIHIEELDADFCLKATLRKPKGFTQSQCFRAVRRIDIIGIETGSAEWQIEQVGAPSVLSISYSCGVLHLHLRLQEVVLLHPTHSPYLCNIVCRVY